MDRHQSRFLLVTGEDGQLLGVVIARDLLRVYLRPDAAIKTEINRDVLSRYLGTNPVLVDVNVTDGVVRLTGELDYAIDDIRLPLGPDQLETMGSPVARRPLTQDRPGFADLGVSQPSGDSSHPAAGPSSL